MTDIDTATRIEALLFSEGGPVSKKRLVQLLEITPAELESGLAQLTQRREGTAITVVSTETEAALVTAPSATPTVEKAFERELGREIGDAGLEVLAIILYRGPSTRAQIDYIRGVNTSSTIRNLTARGLLERIANPADAREYLYRPTTELLAHLGVREGQELPDYGKIASELAAFEKTSEPFTDHAGTANPESGAERE